MSGFLAPARWFKNLFFPPFSEREILILAYIFLLVCVEFGRPVVENLPAAGRYIGVVFMAGPLGLAVAALMGFWIVVGLRRLAVILRSLYRMAGTSAPMSGTEKRIFAFLFYFTLSGVSLAALGAEFLDPRYEVPGVIDAPSLLSDLPGFDAAREGGLLAALNRAIILFVALRALATFLLTWMARRAGSLDFLGRHVDDHQISPLFLVWIGLITPPIYIVVRYAYVLPSAVTLVYFYVSEILYLVDRLDRIQRLNRAVLGSVAVLAATGLAAGVVFLELKKADVALRHWREAGTAALLDGDPAAATADLERALEIALRRYGAGDLRTARLHQRLGIARFHKGDPAGAIRHHERAVAVFSADSSSPPGWTATSLRYLGLAHLRLSDPERAAAHLSRALTLQEGRRPRDPRSVMAIRTDLGMARFAAGDDATAAQWFRAALDTLAELETDDPADAIRLRHQLGRASDRMGDVDGALAAWEAALSHGTARFEAVVQAPEAVYARLGLIHYSAGRYKQAARYLERADARYAATLPEDHPKRRALAYPLGAALTRLGETRGVYRLERLLRRAESGARYDAPVLARLHYHIGLGYDAVENFQTAVNHLARALTLWRASATTKDRGPAAPAVLGPHYEPSLAGEEAALVALLEKNAARWLETFRDHYVNPDLALGLYHAGVFRAERGETGKARPLLTAALEMQDAARGPDHPATRRTRAALAKIESGRLEPP